VPASAAEPPQTSSGSPPPSRRARLVSPRELWGRRSVAIGAILVALAVIGGIVLLIAGGGGSSEPSSSDISKVQDQILTHTVVNPDRGISIRIPEKWTSNKRSGVVNVQSQDHCLAMQFAAPLPAGQAKRLRTDGVKTLRGQYKKVVVRPARGVQVGGIPTTTDAITVTDDKGRQVRLLLAVGTGKKYAYLTETVFRDPSCTADLRVANLVLQAVQYTK
jgi:hypothetical protein